MANVQLYLLLSTALYLFIFSNANYIGTPKKVGNLSGILNKKLRLKCKYTGEDGDGQFNGWYKDGQLINDDDPNHYLIKTTQNESNLTITLNGTDLDVKEWSVQTNKSNQEKPIQCQFGPITLKPLPVRIETDRETENITADKGFIKRQQDESVTLKCILAPNQVSPGRSRRTVWTFSKDNKKFGELPIDVDNSAENEIKIAKVKTFHRGYYNCTRNGVSIGAQLRVKDRFAALWPFIGIVSTVIVLVIGILLFEKHQIAAKKALAVDDGAIDQATDPLVRTTNKSSDDVNKKHAVNV